MWREGGGEGGVQGDFWGGVQNAHAVWADQAHPRLSADTEELQLAFGAASPGLGEPGRYHHQAANSLRGTIPRYIHHSLGRDHYDRKVHGPRDVSHGGI